MHGNLLNKNKVKLFNTANSDLAARILILENNVYKITYYEIISGATGTLTVPTAATINANEFSGANCILSEIDVNNKPTWVSPKNAGGTVVTASLNTGTGAWVKSGVTVSANVALIYSLNIRAADYANLTNFYIVEETVIGDFSYVLNNTTIGTVTSALLANAMSDETGSGSLVFGTSPTFTTDITTPLIIGGTGVGSVIQYKGTTGVGTSTVAAHQFLVGTNGGTTAASIYNSGQVNIGNYATPSAQRLVTIGQDTAFMSFGSLVGTTSLAAIYLGQATPSATNYTITSDGSNVYLNTQSTTGFCYITTGSNTRFYFGRSGMASNFAADISGATTTFSFITPAHTGQSASTEIPNFKITGNTKTWAAGTIATQRWNYFTANTAAFASASTITDSYGLYVEAAVAGTNATITNNWGLGVSGAANITGSLNVGNYATPTAQRLVTIGQDSAWLTIGSRSDGAAEGCIYINAATPTTGNFALSGISGETRLNGTSRVDLRINNSNQIRITGSDQIFSPSGASSGAVTSFTFNSPANTGQTASTEIPNFKITGASKTWAAGTITTQRWNYFTANTAAFASASTITNSYGLYVEAATAGTNATITNNWAAGFSGDVNIISSSAALYLGDLTPSSTNYALKYTAASEISLNAPTTLRLRGGGTIAATATSSGFSISASGGLTLGNLSNDSKILFQRTSGNSHSIQLGTGDYFVYNDTAGAVRYGVTNAGNFYIGAKSALATNATDGFLYVPSCAGAPTGVPTAITGKIPIVADSTNNKMYIYSGGAWVALN